MLTPFGETGVAAESIPWYSKDDIADRPIAVLQAWGWLAEKFQVCLLVTTLDDVFAPNGDALPAIAGISFDADSPDNPRRRWLDYFADPKAGPVGPVMLTRQEANNQQGWVWTIKACPLPVDAAEYAAELERSHHNQGWRKRAIAEYKRRQLVAAAPPPTTAPALQTANGADNLDDLPF